MLKPLRSVVRAARRVPDRLLHPLRRRQSLRRLARFNPTSSVLFVCSGNICRSPYAAAAFRRCLLTDVPHRSLRIDAAGFLEPDRPPPAETVAVAAERDLDLSNHRSRKLSPDLVAESELIVVMDTRQRDILVRDLGSDGANVLVLGDLDPRSIDTRAIVDPIFHPIEVFREVYDRIDRCLEQLARALP